MSTTRDQLQLALAQSLMKQGGPAGSPLAIFGNLARQAAGLQLQRRALDDIDARKQAAQTKALRLLTPGPSINAGVLDEGFEPTEVVRQQNPSRANLISVATNKDVGSAFQNLAAQMYANELAKDRTRQQQSFTADQSEIQRGFTADQSALARTSSEKIAAERLDFQRAKANRSSFEVVKGEDGQIDVVKKIPGEKPELITLRGGTPDDDEKIISNLVAVDKSTGASFPVFQRGKNVFVGRGNGVFDNLGDTAQNYTLSTPTSQEKAAASTSAKQDAQQAILFNLDEIGQVLKQVQKDPSAVGATGAVRSAALNVGRFLDDINAELERFGQASALVGGAAGKLKDLAGKDVGQLKERLKIVGATLNVTLQDLRRINTNRRLFKSELNRIDDLTNLDVGSSDALLTKINELRSYINTELKGPENSSVTAPRGGGQMNRQPPIKNFRVDPNTGTLVEVE